MIELNLEKWKLIAESDNFVMIEKKMWKKITKTDFLLLVEEMRSRGYKPHFINYNWDGQILFEKETK
jgi:hypothetical protein